MSLIPFLFVIAIVAATVYLGVYATKKSQTASDFFVAGRSVGVAMNAAAISGEYLSAASFMGIAGLLMKNGYDALWYPVGYATGYLFLLLFIAGPLRQFGAYTIPDFAEGRFDSPIFRKIAVTFVLFIGFFYTMPQMKGAGVTMTSILGWPYWAGIVVVGIVITFNVAMGGMKGITFVQAFQYWAKVFAISVPIFVLFIVYGGYGENVGKSIDDGTKAIRFNSDTKATIKGKENAPLNVIAGASAIRFPAGAEIAKVSMVRKPKPGESGLPSSAVVWTTLGESGNPGGWAPVNPNGDTLNPNSFLRSMPFSITKGSSPVMENGAAVSGVAKIEMGKKTDVVFPKGSRVPNAPTGDTWSRAYGPLTSKHGYPLLYTYSLIIALVCGTAGLPHILVRFYTNPDGRAAKRTTLWVMVMIGIFYMFPPMWGALGRVVMPVLYANNTTDSVVIKLPTMWDSQLGGQILSGITSAGAFAAFMSTFSGLLVSMSGAMAHDIYGKMLRPNSSSEDQLKAFKISAVAFGLISVILGVFVETFDIAMMVGWAFAIAAASYFPLLLLGSWWRGLTVSGAATGMLVGGLASLVAIVTSMLLDKKILTMEVSPLVRSLMEQPAIWGVPLAIGVMVAVSKMTTHQIPGDVDTKMLRLHAPEEMGISRNYIEH